MPVAVDEYITLMGVSQGKDERSIAIIATSETRQHGPHDDNGRDLILTILLTVYSIALVLKSTVMTIQEIKEVHVDGRVGGIPADVGGNIFVF